LASSSRTSTHQQHPNRHLLCKNAPMPLHHRTPLLPSLALEAEAGRPVWLKLESAQPSASFKLRGMGLAAERAVAGGATRLVSSSGGNAGYAVAWAGRALGVPVTVVVPSSTGARMRRLIEATGAEVRVAGHIWDEAHAAAIAIADETGGVLLHPFDHPDIWEGHSSLIAEVAATGLVPQCVVVAVGGGGLLCGVLQGMQEAGWTDTSVLAVETQGAASFAAALQAGEPVTLPAITSLALTLGSKRVCDRLFELIGAHNIQSLVVSDAAAVKACARFLDDQRVLVEPSCGAALSVLYDGHPALNDGNGPILVVVCGGAGVTASQLEAWLE
jgi:L-serine/L-threonine ammonia-lyase